MELHVLSEKLFGFTLHQHVQRHVRDHFIPHEGNNHLPHVLHHRVLFLYAAFLVLTKLSVLALPIFLPYNFADSLAVTAENVIALTNQSRRDYGLPEFTPSPQLLVAAQNKALDMMKKGYFAHFSPDGVSPWYWIAAAGYNYAFAGENLAVRFTSAEGVNAAWLASASHKANILSKDFSEIGVAVITDNFGDQGVSTLVVQMFGRPSSQTQVSSASPSPPSKSKPSIAVQAASASASVVKTANPAIPSPTISFPLPNSYVKIARFAVLGNAPQDSAVQIFIDGQLLGQTQANLSGNFEFLVPESVQVSEGLHRITARTLASNGLQSQLSSEITIVVDISPPEVYQDQFSMLKTLGKSRSFDITAGVSEDSIRTLATVGIDSAVLEKQEAPRWFGQLVVYHVSSGQSLPVQIYAQDLAGNEATKRVGLLSEGEVRGVFNFVGDGRVEGERQVSLFGGLLRFADFERSVQNFYLYFAAFLSLALILKIGLKRHTQHIRVIVGGSGVVMLAMILFVI